VRRGPKEKDKGSAVMLTEGGEKRQRRCSGSPKRARGRGDGGEVRCALLLERGVGKGGRQRHHAAARGPGGERGHAARLGRGPMQRGRWQPAGADGAFASSAIQGRRVGPCYSLERRRFDLIQIQTKSNSIQLVSSFEQSKKELSKIKKCKIK
jgi:hypothetical protein